MTKYIMKRTDESNEEYLIRLLVAKEKGETDLTWDEIKTLTGVEITTDQLRKESKGVIRASKVYEDKIEKIMEGAHVDGQITRLENKISEEFKERVKLQDARRETRKIERFEARMELLFEELKLAVESIPPIKFKNKPKNVLADTTKEGLAICSDWHIGAVIDNELNQFNLDIAKERILQFANEVIYYGRRENLKRINIANLGDMINGHIHVSTRILSELDVIQQTKICAELMSEFVGLIANEFDEVRVINVMGNHGRTQSKKDEAIINENLEKFIPWYMELRLSEFDNITMINEEKGLAKVDILGHKIAFVHGHYERKGRPQNLNDAYGTTFNFIILGHFHHLEAKDIGIRTESIINRCLSGADDYALTLRKTSKAGQKFVIFSEKGIIQDYNTIF